MADVQFSAAPTTAYLLVRLACVGLARLLFKIDLGGLVNLPHAPDGRSTGGWIAAGLPHRNWVEPFLLFAILPAQPRSIAIAEAATISSSRWRRMLIGAAGGAIPVGLTAKPSGFHAIVRATKGAIDAGAVVTIFPEAGPPSRPPQFRPLSRGVAHFAARTGAPVVPVIFGGTHELYLRRRIVVRILPAIAPPASAGRPDTTAFMAELRSRAEAAAADAHEVAESAPPSRKPWRWLTGHYPRV